MEAYLFVKWLHILGAMLLFGTGLGTAFHFWHALRTGNVATIAASARVTVLADWLFTLTSGIAQPLTGLWLAANAGYPLSSTWIAGSLVLYVVAAACWIPVVFIQLRMRTIAETSERARMPLGDEFHRLARRWFFLGWPAFLALAGLLWLMVAKPA